MSGELLPQDERAVLADCERIIEDGYTTFLKVGLALAKVRDSRLYRADYETFEAYCDKRWGFTKTHAYRLIGSAGIAEALSPIGDIPALIESQAREVSDLPLETALTVVRAAAQSGPLTAASIREAREEIAPKPARITTTTRTSEATKVEHDVDLETGEITSPGSNAPLQDSAPGVEQPSEPGALDPVSEAIERYPALDIEKASDDDILKVAAALDKITDESQMSERIENGRRWLVAKSEGRLGNSTPLDPCQSGDEITELCLEAAMEIRGAGGADAFADAWASADNLTRANWQASLYSLETILNDLRTVTQAKQLRSV